MKVIISAAIINNDTSMSLKFVKVDLKGLADIKKIIKANSSIL